MNFKSIKIYLLIILIAANIFLLINLYNTSVKEDKLDETAVNDTVQILAQNGITVDKSTIPEYTFKADVFECSFDSDYYESIPEQLTGEKRESVNILPNNNIKVTLKVGDYFVFNNSFGVDFTKNGYDVKREDEFNDFLSDDAHSLRELKITTADDNEIKCADFLLSHSLDKSNSAFSYKFEQAFDFNGAKILQFCQTINNIKIKDHIMYVEIKDKIPVRAKGKWFYPKDSSSYPSKLYQQFSVLFEELEYKKNTDSAPYGITNIDTAYCIYWKSSQDGLYFIPTWELTTDAGENRFYNAINCELYK